VLPIVDPRPTASVEAEKAGAATSGNDGGAGSRKLRWRYRILLVASAVVVAASAVALTTRAVVRLAVSSPSGSQAVVAAGGVGVVRVIPATGAVLPGPSLSEVNGITEGLGSIWLSGGDAANSHVLYGVNPVTSRIDARVNLPSLLVINPGDIAAGNGAIWAAVGSSVYRVQLGTIAAGGVATRAFATLPHAGTVGDIAVDAGGVWVTSTTSGTVYRFAASTGRLQAKIPIGATAGAMAVGDGGIWVANGDAHKVTRINVATNRIDSVVTIPGPPTHLAAGASGLWVTDGTGDLYTLPAGSSGPVLTIRIGGQLTGVAATGDTAWVADTANGTVTRIDARRHTVMATVRVGARPYGIAASGPAVWVALLGRYVMHHSQSSPGGVLGLLERLCGVS
jgi:YVTN family beta-propeller protein